HNPHTSATLHATPHPPPLSLHDALPIFRSSRERAARGGGAGIRPAGPGRRMTRRAGMGTDAGGFHSSFQSEGSSAIHGRTKEPRSEEHTSELQSPCNLVCRLLLEKKKDK